MTERSWQERIDVLGRVRTHTEDEHRARYVWAAERVTGQVLDVACGTGHGTQLLAARCDATGLDRDQDAVAIAQAKTPRAAFHVASMPPIPCDDGSFDAVVSFETIEHLEPDVEFLAEVRRVLKPGGRLLLSSPNRAASSPNDAAPLNPYHVREYLLPDLLSLVRDRGFAKIDVYYQRKERRRLPEYAASAVVSRVPRLCQPGRWWDRLAHGSGEVEAWDPDVTHPLFWVLDCR
jgi:SAM-dependent methyltransferase